MTRIVPNTFNRSPPRASIRTQALFACTIIIRRLVEAVLAEAVLVEAVLVEAVLVEAAVLRLAVQVAALHVVVQVPVILVLPFTHMDVLGFQKRCTRCSDLNCLEEMTVVVRMPRPFGLG